MLRVGVKQQPRNHSLLKLYVFYFSGDNVEDAFLDTAKKIYQNIQDGRFVEFQIISWIKKKNFKSKKQVFNT